MNVICWLINQLHLNFQKWRFHPSESLKCYVVYRFQFKAKIIPMIPLKVYEIRCTSFVSLYVKISHNTWKFILTHDIHCIHCESETRSRRSFTFLLAFKNHKRLSQEWIKTILCIARSLHIAWHVRRVVLKYKLMTRFLCTQEEKPLPSERYICRFKCIKTTRLTVVWGQRFDVMMS